MTVLVAIEPGRGNTAAIELTATLATAAHEPVVATTVAVVPPGVPSPLRVGMPDERFAELLAADGLDEARAALGDGLERVVGLRERSVRAGLLTAIEQEAPSALVLGSGAGGALGHVQFSDTISGMLHTATVPVVIAPDGYRRADPDRPLRRITVAFGPDEASLEALVWAAHVADAADTQLRTVTFWVRQASSVPPAGGAAYEAEIAAQWKTQMTDRLDAAVRHVREQAIPTRYIHTEFADGNDWTSAMAAVEWEPGDLLIVGSRPPSGLRSVFLGSRSAEILRRSPVPVVVLPG